MFRDKIDLKTAKALEKDGYITIVDASLESLPPFGKEGQQWKDNLTALRETHRHIPLSRLLDFLSARYLIEASEGLVDKASNTYCWRYFYGIENSKVKEKSIDNIEYVYVLVNPADPSLVKIGMTTYDVPRRVKEINATATIEEWVAKFALPVGKGKSRIVERCVHNFFAPLRVSSDHESSREFFRVSP